MLQLLALLGDVKYVQSQAVLLLFHVLFKLSINFLGRTKKKSVCCFLLPRAMLCKGEGLTSRYHGIKKEWYCCMHLQRGITSIRDVACSKELLQMADKHLVLAKKSTKTF